MRMCFLVFSQILLLFDDFMASLIRLGLVQTSWQSRSQVLPTNMENAGIHLDSLHIYIYIYAFYTLTSLSLFIQIELPATHLLVETKAFWKI